tara:strand:- start:133 stop:1137 length:1005 start_codon:yes stop_codon:yes gene_type:complete
MNNKLDRIIALADREARGNDRLYNTVVKEGLHRDILSCIAQSGLSREIVFQGGTALRLCYDNNRYSEDLDFVTEKPVSDTAIEKFKTLLSDVIGNDYAAQVEFKDPKQPQGPANATGIEVRRWSVKIGLDGLPGSNKTKQLIHVEVAEGIPALDAKPRAIKQFTAQPLQASPPIILQVSSKEEILADKLVALIGRQYLKARDIWDIKFLIDSNTSINDDWVIEKCGHYGIADTAGDIARQLNEKASELAGEQAVSVFKNEMSRFLGKEQAQSWLSQPFGTEAILMEVSEIVEKIATQINAKSTSTPSETVSTMHERLEKWRARHQKDNNDEPSL